jgi:exosortase B
MTYLQALDPAKSTALQKFRPLLGPMLVAACFLAAYFPTFKSLLDGPWQTEQEGHGPLIIAAAFWLIWQSRHRLKSAPILPALASGWAVLLSGLILMFLARTQGVLTVEVFSALPVIIGCVLILGGWAILRVLAFPILFLLFAVPVPDWAIDAATVPLKVLISDAVTQVLYAAGYPIAQNGVMIMIGSYQLLVKDACSGMNSIFALSAIGVFYVYAFRRNEKIRGLLLLAAIVPITILANFLRVLVVALIAYQYGTDVLERGVHDFTGIGLFIVAIALMFLLDGLLTLLAALFQRTPKPATS